ncbi:MAG: hypothetical protein FJX67_04870 [Alphaproteobacteria bacterium]|nr:hypothetical protein [Alphaproteobacteria bacterium]
MDTASPAAPATTDPADRDALLARARALVPVLAARADETERRRTLLPEVHDALAAAGLFRILLPADQGGLGAGIRAHIEVAATLAEGCASTAWTQSLVGYQNYLVGWYPARALAEVRADGRPLFTGLVMGPPVTAAYGADGAVILDGRWPYVSGADYASWFLLSARAPEDPKRVLTSLVPRRDVRIEDDWYAMGMRGTGSKSVHLDKLVVPAHRVAVYAELGRRDVAAAKGDDTRPTGTLFAFVIAAPAVGIAEAAINAYRDRLVQRWNARMPSSQTEWPSSQSILGRAVARLDGARRQFLAVVAEFAHRYEAGETVPVADRVRMRMMAVEAVDVATRVVYDLFCDAGTGVALDGDPLQRAFRDIHVLRSHFVLTPAFAAENAGRVEFGLAPKPPFV